MATTQLKNTELAFTNTDSNIGSLSFTSAKEFEMNRPLRNSQGIVASTISITQGGSFTAATDFKNANIENLGIGDSNGKVTLEANSATTDHTLTLPGTQGAADAVLSTDGSGNLSWEAPYAPTYAYFSGYKSASQFVTTSPNRIQPWSQEHTENFTDSSGQLTPSVSGLYQLTLHCHARNWTSTTTHVIFTLFSNSSSVATIENARDGDTPDVSLHLTKLVSLTASQAYEMQIKTNNSTLNASGFHIVLILVKPSS